MQANTFGILTKRQVQKQQTYHLVTLARYWNRPVRAGLTQLAQRTWPNGRLFGLIPARRYRLRQRYSPDSCLWWVEHDIPPYDQYWCAAYRVELTLTETGTPTLKVQSATTIQPVQPLTQENLIKILGQAADEPPLLIARQMGRADNL